jgi:hypothetical protein
MLPQVPQLFVSWLRSTQVSEQVTAGGGQAVPPSVGTLGWHIALKQTIPDPHSELMVQDIGPPPSTVIGRQSPAWQTIAGPHSVSVTQAGWPPSVAPPPTHWPAWQTSPL